MSGGGMSGGGMANGDVSFWWSSLGGPRPRRPLDGAISADVCIVGGGFTGLWTAYYLARSAPGLRVVVVERDFCGFGASGRNGGWLSGLLPGRRDVLAARGGGVEAVKSLQRLLYRTVDEVLAVCRAEKIDADGHKGGSLRVATTPAQLGRLRSGLAEDRHWGVSADDAWELSASDLAERIAIPGALGAVFTPHCARVHPAKLVVGLAAAAEARGVKIFEATPVRRLGPRLVETPTGDITARYVLQATEGFGAGLQGQRRRLLPMNSSMVVTEPLSAAQWATLGWDGHETVGDAAHVYIYAQRTADGRLALGGRGVPYRFGSRTDNRGATGASTIAGLDAARRRLFPATVSTPLAHAWSGVLGVARDWCATVALDDTGLGWAGGYVGDGVAASNLAGRTLAGLVLGPDGEHLDIPWVNHRSRGWEPEPLRWAGVTGIYALYRAADRAEARGRPSTSPWAQLADRISGRP